jgi:hypothetical protein
MTAKHKPTDETRSVAQALSGFGVRQDDIAKHMGIDPKTLRQHYRAELDMGEINANVKVAQTLYEQATDPDNPKSTTAAIFWLKARAGWSERVIVDNTSSDGSMTPKGGLDVSKLSTDALAEIMAAQDATKAE